MFRKITLKISNLIKCPFYYFFYFINIKFKILQNISCLKNYTNYRNYPIFLQEEAALMACLPLAKKFCIGEGLDIGAGKFGLPGAKHIDNDKRNNAYNLGVKANSQNYIFSSHTLEHLDKPWLALDIWFKALVKNGIIFLYLPHPSCKLWQPDNLPFHKWSPEPFDIESYLLKNNFIIEYITYLPDAYFSFVVIGRKN